MLRISFFIQFIYSLRNGFFDSVITRHRFVHVVERDEIMVVEVLLVQPPCLAHQSAQSVAIDRMLEERFRSPDEHLRVFCRQISDAQRPCYEVFPPFVEVCDTQLAAETFVFRKVVAQGIAQWQWLCLGTRVWVPIC